jgi:hypothetical protein
VDHAAPAATAVSARQAKTVWMRLIRLMFLLLR